LLPKKIDASNIKNYRPISLINYSFKIITNLVANRLATVMDYLIDSTQTVYIKDRSIMDNVVCAHAVLHQVRLSKSKGLLFKIDFEKVFDRVNWDFLLEILVGRGFRTKWITWIQSILECSKTCINFNGQIGPYFHCKRGVRQGDPLSPFLFDLVADVLNILLKNDKNLGYLKGLGSIGSFEGILNLHFADDTLLFLEAKTEYIEILKWILVAFEDLSGLKINFDKCEMVPFNISDEEEYNLAQILGCTISHLTITYLGVPLHNKTLTKDH
jgi:Reverse transcriptase (RNA-dependent DNA polymerase)